MEAILSKDDYKTFTEKVDVASTKGVKTSVLPYMLLKALQEANAEIVALKARVNTLEGS